MKSTSRRSLSLTRATLYGIGVAFTISVALLMGAVAPAFLGVAGTAFIMEAFSTLCHQIAERSPHLYEQQLAVCHRCLGIYAGLAAGPVLMIGFLKFRRLIRAHTPWILLVGVTPAALDWFAAWVGLWVNTPSTRIITGLLFGLTAGICMARAFADTFEQESESKQERRGPRIAKQA